MAILFITHKYPPAVGGMENQSFQLINGYKNIYGSYDIIYTGKEHIALFFLKLKFRVKKMLRQHPDIKIIHLNDGLMGAFFSMLRVNAQGRKVVVTLHGLEVVFPLSVYQKKILPKLMTFDAFICVSEATKQECKKRNFPDEKLIVVNNGVENKGPFIALSDKYDRYISEELGIDIDHDKILLAIGRPVRRKGFSWFAREVIPLLHPSYKFVHIGISHHKEPYLLQILPDKVKNLVDLFFGKPNDVYDLYKESTKRPDRIIRVGKVDNELRDYLISKATLMIMPNIMVSGDMEGFGLVSLEASVKGKTVLAADIEGITDAIYNGKNGYLVKAGDTHAWREQIIRHSRLSSTNNEKFRKFTLEHFLTDRMVNGYHDVFNNL
ncbi:MAG: glycosyltransferase family 4 protein [Saprospiraceae bacterium]|nr:glycosyltransferase family 4 protein [Saprospiraceae bacterium]